MNKNLMNKIAFPISLLFAPLAYAIHLLEENFIFDFRAWRLQYFADSNALSTEVIFVILTAITLTGIIIHMIVENRASAQAIILFIMATQVHNVIFHTGGTIYFKDFSPGLITALLIYIPMNVLIVYTAHKEDWVSNQSLIFLFIFGGIAFWLFERFGPIIIMVVLTSTYAWVAYETIISQRERSRTLSTE
jgi:hypothetical protein